MNKPTLIAELMVFAMINVILYVYTGGEFSDVQMVSMLFINLSFIVTLISPLFVPDIKNKYHFSATMMFISGVYLIIALVIGIAFIVIDWDNFVFVSIIQTIVFVIAVVSLLLEYSIDIPSSEYEEDTRRYREDFAEEIRGNMNRIINTVDEQDVRKKLEKTCDSVVAMPFKSKNDTAEMDQEILDISRIMLDHVSNGRYDDAIALCENMDDVVARRNAAFKRGRV